MACLNHKRKRSRQSQAHDEHQPITEIKSQQPAFRTHTRVLGTCSSAPDELAQLSLSGCSFEDTLDRNYFRWGDPLNGMLLEPITAGCVSVVPPPTTDRETVVAGI